MDSILPKYVIIKQDLVRRIQSEELRPDQLVPSETELMKAYQVSRATARKALEVLTNDGYLVKIQGKGTFVRRRPVSQSLTKVSGYTEEILRLGMVPTRKVLSSEVTPCAAHLAAILGVAPGSEVFVLERIYYADGEPLCHTTTTMPLSLFPGLPECSFAERSLYEVLERNYPCHISRCLLSMEAVSATPPITRHLQVGEGTPLLQFSATTLGQMAGQERIIEYFETFYLTRKTRYTLEQIR